MHSLSNKNPNERKEDGIKCSILLLEQIETTVVFFCHFKAKISMNRTKKNVIRFLLKFFFCWIHNRFTKISIIDIFPNSSTKNRIHTSFQPLAFIYSYYSRSFGWCHVAKQMTITFFQVVCVICTKSGRGLSHSFICWCLFL